MGIERFAVPVDKLRRVIDPNSLQGLERPVNRLSPIGQERAEKALLLGLRMRNVFGYNIFVAGQSGTGRTSLVEELIEQVTEERKDKDKPAGDLCYLFNMENFPEPWPLELPAGKGKVLRERFKALFEKIEVAAEAALFADDFAAFKEELLSRHQQIEDEIIQKAADEVKRLDLVPHPQAGFPPAARDDPSRSTPMKGGEYASLAPDERKEIEANQAKAFSIYREMNRKISILHKKRFEQMKELILEAFREAIYPLLEEEARVYSHIPQLEKYITAFMNFFLENTEIKESPQQPGLCHANTNPVIEKVFEVNVLVDNSENLVPPVVFEENATFPRLFGEVRKRWTGQGYYTDHTMLIPGAFHRANGGYLIINIRDVLQNALLWNSFKKVLLRRKLGFEDLYGQLGLPSHDSMPKPIDIDVKVITMGSPWLYYLLSHYDEDFDKIFKILADFETSVDYENNIQSLVDVINFHQQTKDLLPFTPEAKAKIIEQSLRTAADQNEISTRIRPILNLMDEAYALALGEDSAVTAEHIETAIEQRIYRFSRSMDRLRRFIKKGDLRIDIGGEAVGQINILGAYHLGDGVILGAPSRSTFISNCGKPGLTDIDIEVKYTDKSHQKGTLVYMGYLSGRYAQEGPLSFSATGCIEQEYEETGGPSASAAHLFALLSSLSGVPIKQCYAVTGGVGQAGDIQFMGGINQKIEGFFDVCRERGLTGEQGVIIPHHNLDDLMLREDVVETVRQGMFHVYTIKTVEEGMEILTGRRMSEVDDSVRKRLKQLREASKKSEQKEKRNWFVRLIEQLGEGAGTEHFKR